MRGLPQLPKEYFEKFTDKPVKLKPFDPSSRVVAKKYIKKLQYVLQDFDLEIIHRGSTAFRIAGKRDVEIGVYPKKSDWKKILEKLVQVFGKADNLEEDYARFNDDLNGFEVEIILMKGHSAKVDKRLTKYLLRHPRLLKQYERLKYKYAYSKKEYMIQKDKFFRKVISQIPNAE